MPDNVAPEPDMGVVAHTTKMLENGVLSIEMDIEVTCDGFQRQDVTVGVFLLPVEKSEG